MPVPTRIVLADDHRLVRTAIRRLLQDEEDLEVVDEASSVQELQTTMERSECDLLILDLRMGSDMSFDSLREIRSRHPSTRILILSMYPDSDFGVPAIRAGATGYVSKDADPCELLSAVRRVSSGGSYTSAELASSMIGATGSGRFRGVEQLSQRETTVLRAIAAGERVSDIALRLGLSDRTVSTYRSRILRKLNCSTNAEISRAVYDRYLN